MPARGSGAFDGFFDESVDATRADGSARGRNNGSGWASRGGARLRSCSGCALNRANAPGNFTAPDCHQKRRSSSCGLNRSSCAVDTGTISAPYSSAPASSTAFVRCAMNVPMLATNSFIWVRSAVVRSAATYVAQSSVANASVMARWSCIHFSRFFVKPIIGPAKPSVSETKPSAAGQISGTRAVSCAAETRRIDVRSQQRIRRGQIAGLLRRNVDELAGAGLIGAAQREQRAAGGGDPGVRPRGDRAGAQRFAVAVPGDRHRAGRGLHDQVGREIAGFWAGGAERGDRYPHQPRIHALQFGVFDARRCRRAGIDDEIGVGCEFDRTARGPRRCRGR